MARRKRKVCVPKDMCDLPRLPGCCELSITWYPLFTAAVAAAAITAKWHGKAWPNVKLERTKQFYFCKVSEQETKRGKYEHVIKKLYLYKYKYKCTSYSCWDERLHILWLFGMFVFIKIWTTASISPQLFVSFWCCSKKQRIARFS